MFKVYPLRRLLWLMLIQWAPQAGPDNMLEPSDKCWLYHPKDQGPQVKDIK